MFLIKWLLKILFKILIFLAVWAALFWVLFNWPVKDKNENMEFNVCFSNIFAEEIGLDWKQAYIAILDDLKPQKIRIASYWNRVEKNPGKYDFSEVEWQIQQARDRNVQVILVFGVKTPRWPECFIPDFYMDSKEEREKALLAYEKALIEKFKGYNNIKVWQVENEPFLAFGDCIEGAIDGNLLDKEIELVKSLDDSRPIMVTDSGELSYWHEAAKRGDIFGTTLYRIIHKEPFGYIKYPLGPNFFRLKGHFVGLFADQSNIIISELQAEPWGPKRLDEMSIEEQYKSMNPQIFSDIVEYAQKTNFSSSYLWGAEWWYWLKEEKENNEMWQAAEEVINQRR